MLFELSLARHQRCSSVSVSKHLSIFGRYSPDSKDRARSTKAPEASTSKPDSVLGIEIQILRRQTLALYSSTSTSKSSGRCLCLALRPAGLAFSSGFAWVRGCPGGAPGLRIALKIGRPSRCLVLFVRDCFAGISLFPKREDYCSGDADANPPSNPMSTE